MNPTETFDVLIDKLEGRSPSDRLMVMAQNPANNHHWSLGIATVTAAELLHVLNVGRAALLMVAASKEEWAQ